MAAGVSLKEEQVAVMRRKLNEQTTLTEEDFVPKVMIDVPMPIDYITPELVKEFSMLEPFGKGNEKPVFADKNLTLLSMRVLGKNGNACKMKIKSSCGRVMEAVYFGDTEKFKNYIEEKFTKKSLKLVMEGKAPDKDVMMSFVYYPEINYYNGKESLQIVVKNYR